MGKAHDCRRCRSQRWNSDHVHGHVGELPAVLVVFDSAHGSFGSGKTEEISGPERILDVANLRAMRFHGIDVTVIDGDRLSCSWVRRGCGKSTLLRWSPPRRDQRGRPHRQPSVNDWSRRIATCAFVFQNYALYPHMTCTTTCYGLKIPAWRRPLSKNGSTTRPPFSTQRLLERSRGSFPAAQRHASRWARVVREPPSSCSTSRCRI